jgi:hypothetical protein
MDNISIYFSRKIRKTGRKLAQRVHRIHSIMILNRLKLTVSSISKERFPISS